MFGDLTRVGANFHAMEAWSNLKRVNGDIGQIQSRLSTGKRINSAEDDTSGYALSKHLESRTRGLSQALDNVGTAKNVLNIAEGGYQSQMSILQTVKEKMTQAADGSLSDAQRGAIGDQVEALLKEFDDISSDTKFNDNALFTGTTTTFQVGEQNGDTLGVILSTSTRDAVGEETGANVVNIDSIVQRIENEVVSGGDGSADVSFGIPANFTTGDADTLFSVTKTDSTGTESAFTNFTIAADGVLTIANADISDGDSFSLDFTYQGTFSDMVQSEAQAGITKLDSAIKSLAKSIQSVGDYNARLSSKEESLSLAISNTEATRSRIEDADFAKEQMSMMKLQILQQTSVSSFSQANSAPQMVLSLMR